MKFTLGWLKDHLDTDASLDEIATTLSAIGLEVDGIENPAEKLGAFTVAKVLEAKQHPNADRLQVLQVETEPGKPALEIVCGAPNARAGMYGVFAPIGTYVPGLDVRLVEKPVRGVVSNGMMCSPAELQLSEESDGIVDIDAALNPTVGQSYVSLIGIDDPVIEVGLTPNRPDCTGVRGIARDLAAAGLGQLKPEIEIEGIEGEDKCPINIKLEFSEDTADACPVFAGRYVKGVKNGPSPDMVRNRLIAIGLRPINALVDVTNYISYDRGRPLHVYDADKLKGAVRARLGIAGESFLGLDGKTYEADDGMCVIADDSGPLGFGGVMGGEETGCTDETTNVLIESAWFDPVRTAQTGRRTGLITDARYRFERGVDPQSVLPGLDLATKMIVEACGGEPSKSKVAGKPPNPKVVIPFDTARVKKLTGLQLKDAEIKSILEALGFKCSGKASKLKVACPTWRPDVHGPADLVEEVVRIAGIDTVPSVPLPRDSGVAKPVLTGLQKRARRARRILASRGFVEAITWSFIPRAHSECFGGGDAALELANPISTEMSSMRPSLLPGLLSAAQRNNNRGFGDLAQFEIGNIYHGDDAQDQVLTAGAVRIGSARHSGSGRHWDGQAANADVFEAKADAAAVLRAAGLNPAKAQVTNDAPDWYHPGRSGTLRLGPKNVLAHFGEFHPRALKTLDLDGAAVGFEVFLSALPPEKAKSRMKAALDVADLLPVRRDFAFVLDRDVAAGDVLRAARMADKTLIADITIFDVFEGGNLAAEGKKSLALEVTLQPTEATLTDSDIEAVSQKVIAAVQQATGGEIRS